MHIYRLHRSNIIVLAIFPIILLALLLSACSSGNGTMATQAIPSPSPTPDGTQVLAKANAAFNGAKTLHTLLNINITGSAFSGTINAEVWNEQPAKQRTVVQQSTLAQLPSGEITVSNGKQVWQYDPSQKVVYTAPVSGTGTNPSAEQDTSQFLLTLVRSIFNSSHATLVSSSASLKGHVVYDVHVEQSVQAATQRFNYTGEVYLDKLTYLPVETVITVQDFGQTTIDFSTLELNKPVDEALFTFVPPAGVKVQPFPKDTGATGSLTLAQAQQQAGYHLLSIPTSQAAYALQSVDALGAPGNQIYTLNYLYNGSTSFTISEGKALANLPSSGQPVKVRGANGSITTVGSTATLSWTENGVGIQVAGPLSNAQLLAVARLLT